MAQPRPAEGDWSFPRGRILVFGRTPEPGRVKTRLEPALGAAGAAALYRFMLGHVLATAAAAGLCPVELWLADAPGPATDGAGFIKGLAAEHGVAVRRQAGADLGERMHAALAEALEGADAAVLVGSDYVDLEAAELAAALAALGGGADAVFTPVEDGGYRLVGLRRPRAGLFRDIAWGGPEVMAQTRGRLGAAGLEWRELPMGWDVDEPADLARLARVPGLPEGLRRLLDEAGFGAGG